METVRIYVACLAAYNNAKLHGAWIDVNGKDENELMEEINQRVLKTSPEPDAEEWAIHDDECSFYEIGEWEGLETIAKLGELAESYHDNDAIKTFLRMGIVDITEDDVIEILEKFEEAYRGRFDSEKDIAYDYVDNGCLGEIPEALNGYIDYEAIAYDLLMDMTYENGHLFYNY